MQSRKKRGIRFRDIVYVIGAGFSHGCGYPLMDELLPKVWAKLEDNDRKELNKIIQFHYPRFDANNADTFPNIENLLTQISVNIDLFDMSRRNWGNFRIDDLIHARMSILRTIESLFHDIYKSNNHHLWLKRFLKMVKTQQAAIITFNWDLLLDHGLFGKRICSSQYGLTKKLPQSGSVILKPHGSLNWYRAIHLKSVKQERHTRIFNGTKMKEHVDAFVLPRAIRSKTGKRYTPLLVPPTYLKDFHREIFQHIWNQATDVLSTPKRIIFLGYSLPDDDLQAKFILRCGFHNQLDGIPTDTGRTSPTDNSEVVVVNPSVKVANRIRSIINTGSPFKHHKMCVETWLAESLNQDFLK